MKMRLHNAILSLTLLSLSGIAYAQTDHQKEYKGLAKADYFAVGGVGFVGSISENEKNLWPLITAKDEKRLLALTQEKNPVARLYGLLGLRYINSPQYKTEGSKLQNLKVTASTLSGCIKSTQPVSTIADQIVKGDFNKVLDYDLTKRKPK